MAEHFEIIYKNCYVCNNYIRLSDIDDINLETALMYEKHMCNHCIIKSYNEYIRAGNRITFTDYCRGMRRQFKTCYFECRVRQMSAKKRKSVKKRKSAKNRKSAKKRKSRKIRKSVKRY